MKNIRKRETKNSPSRYTIMIVILFFLFSSYFFTVYDKENKPSTSQIQNGPQISAINDINISRNFTNNSEFIQGEKIDLTFSFSYTNSTNSYYILSQNEHEIIFNFLNNSMEEITIKLNTNHLGIITFNITIYSDITNLSLPYENIEFQEIYHVIITLAEPLNIPLFGDTFLKFAIFGMVGAGLLSFSIFTLKKIQFAIQTHLLKNLNQVFDNSIADKEFLSLKMQDSFISWNQSRKILKYSIDNHNQNLLDVENISDEYFWEELFGKEVQI